jgi:hypothetical protein
MLQGFAVVPLQRQIMLQEAANYAEEVFDDCMRTKGFTRPEAELLRPFAARLVGGGTGAVRLPTDGAEMASGRRLSGWAKASPCLQPSIFVGSSGCA